MVVELQINNSSDPRARYVSWSPSPCRVRVTNPAGAPGPTVNIRMTSTSTAGGGQVKFRRNQTGAFSNTITLQVPTNGASAPFFVAGRFGFPSRADQDVRIDARRGNTVVGTVHVMVRVRKNANNLAPAERDRLVAAFAQLNNQGMGRFADFRDMHTAVSSAQAHGAKGFLPWHRAYLLDLERELQNIDPSVSLAYWRFDQPAPNLFTPEFFGGSDQLGTVTFSTTNPLQFWITDGVQGINRRPFFDTATAPGGVATEAQTFALGNAYPVFWMMMEGNPHGAAHVSFGGSISSVPTAARDPLFFLLHCNVDRLWAKWQRLNGRFDPAVAASYDNAAAPIGHNLPDTMWPWNGITGGTRPPTAPGGAMSASLCVAAPGDQPQVHQTLDYQGTLNAASRLGFDYDDVTFA
jgi:tyrosinase